jgi:hypothetical protein
MVKVELVPAEDEDKGLLIAVVVAARAYVEGLTHRVLVTLLEDLPQSGRRVSKRLGKDVEGVLIA